MRGRERGLRGREREEGDEFGREERRFRWKEREGEENGRERKGVGKEGGRGSWEGLSWGSRGRGGCCGWRWVDRERERGLVWMEMCW